MKVPIVQLTLPDDVLQEVSATLKSGMWAEGKPVRELESEFAKYCGAKYCRAVNSGTAALMSIAACLPLIPGDEVIVPSFTFIATANCLIPLGLKPKFADIDPLTFNISPESIEKKISARTRSILPVDFYGLCADYKKIEAIAKKHNLFIIEDACQAHGAEINGKKSGSFGTASAFSLYPTKNMFCGGEGGLITTNDEQLYQNMNRFVNHGQREKYIHNSIGYNFRMMNVAGIVAKYSLKMLDANNAKRIEYAKLYNDLLKGVKGVTIPETPNGMKHVFHQYTIRTNLRDKLVQAFEKEQIGYGIHYKIPIHLQEYYKSLGYKDSLPITEKASDEVISLPVHPMLSEEQVRFVVSVIKQIHA